MIELILRLRQDAASALQRLAKIANDETGDDHALRLALDSALCELYGLRQLRYSNPRRPILLEIPG